VARSDRGLNINGERRNVLASRSNDRSRGFMTPQEEGLEAALRLEQLFHAETKLEMWRAKSEYASSKVDCWTNEVERLKAISRGIPSAVKPYARY